MNSIFSTNVDAGTITPSVDGGNSIGNVLNYRFIVNLNKVSKVTGIKYEQVSNYNYIDANVNIGTGIRYTVNTIYQATPIFFNGFTLTGSPQIVSYTSASDYLIPIDSRTGYFITKPSLNSSAGGSVLGSVIGRDIYGNLQTSNPVQIFAGIGDNFDTVEYSTQRTGFTPLSGIDPSQNVLIVYNTNNADSVSLKNYYLSKRTGLATSNILGLNFSSDHSSNPPNSKAGAWMDFKNYNSKIRNPILNYLTSSPKPIKYVILMYDIPVVVTGDNFTFYNDATGGSLTTGSVTSDLSLYNSYNSTSVRNSAFNSNFNDIYLGALTTTFNTYPYPNFTFAQFGRNTALFTHITASTPWDVSGYINKIVNRGKVQGVYLKGSGQNQLYVLNDAPDGYSNVLKDYATVLSGSSGIGARVDYQSTIPNQTLKISGGDVAGFAFWGTHTMAPGVLNTYSTNGEIRFTGYNWYIIETLESFNGWIDYGGQGTFSGWFASGAFGLTGYDNCPVGAVCHTYEPSLGGINSAQYFMAWHTGMSFIEAAWLSRGSLVGTCIGDPFVIK